jgi:hypothetical protein
MRSLSREMRNYAKLCAQAVWAPGPVGAAKIYDLIKYGL